MTTNRHLLPMGASTLEQKAAICAQAALQNKIPITDLFNPDQCPEPFLPYLAWAFSVDKWDENWQVERKRQAIKQSYFIHSKKGTISAIRRVVEPIGKIISIKEWHQTTPKGKAGTVQIEIETTETGIDENTNREAMRLIDDVRPISRHITIALVITPNGELNAFSASYGAEILTVYAE